MSLKRKIILNLALIFSLVFGVMMILIYISFRDFRKSEFKERFRQRLVFTVHIISQSKNFEADATKFFIEDADDVLLNEQILIFNQDKKLIYSTLKDQEIQWDSQLLRKLDKDHTIYSEQNGYEQYAALSKIKGENYYIVTTAQDVNGEKKLTFLRYLLTLSYLLSVVIIVILSHLSLSKFLRPLEDLNREISDITAQNLNAQLPERNYNDEIDILTKSFNTMLAKLNAAFESQKDFTSSAAHEIRTPLTRMAFQLQNLQEKETHSPETRQILEQLNHEVYQLSLITSSLLLLAKFDQDNIRELFEKVRIDEVIFQAYTKINKSYPTLKIDFEIDEHGAADPDLTVKGVKSLLEIAFGNLLKNAALYSDSKVVKIILRETEFSMYIDLSSDGQTISVEDQRKIFQAFTRGENSQQTAGSGLGLKIVNKILKHHQANIKYKISPDGLNVFRIIFRKKFLSNP